MIKVKDGYAKLINTSYTGDISLVLLSNGGTIGYDVSTNTILATIGSNVASADKLKNKVKIWGLDFDGSSDVVGDLLLGTSKILGEDAASIVSAGDNHLVLGYGYSEKGWPTYVDGNSTYFRYGTSHLVGMLLDSSGKVGIGTITPHQKLDVSGKIKADALYLTRSNGDVAFTIAEESGTGGYNITASGGSSFIRFYTNSGGSSAVEQMRIHTNGCVGIGTSAPSYKLHVAGSGYFESYLSIGTASTASLSMNRTSANYITTPTSGYMVFCMGGNSTSVSSSNLVLYTHDVAMAMSGGNVGVGTAYPIHKLHVVGNTWATGFIKQDSSDNYVLLGGGGHKLLSELGVAGSYVTLDTNLTISGIKTFSTLLNFTVALGTAPFTVTSTTKVDNLNADLLDGKHDGEVTAQYFSPGKLLTSSDTINKLMSGIYCYINGDNPTGSVDDNVVLLSFRNTGRTDMIQFVGAANTSNLYYRRAANIGNQYENWTSWKQIAFIDLIPTVTNYYWANVKVSSSSSTTTSPTFANATLSGKLTFTTAAETASISFLNGELIDGYGNVLLGTNSASWNVFNSSRSSLITALSSGNVGIGTSPSYKLHVNGQAYSTGYVRSGSSDSYVLLGGGGHKVLSDFAMASAYVKKAGDTMTGSLNFTTGNVIITTASTSNYKALGVFYKGSASASGTYDAQIGWHNTGDTNGALTLLPYATTTSPWDGSVGLYITKTLLKYNGASVWHSGNDGSGSGLDADTVDSCHKDDFLRRTETLGYLGKFVLEDIPKGVTQVGSIGWTDYQNHPHAGGLWMTLRGISSLSTALILFPSYSMSSPPILYSSIDGGAWQGGYQLAYTSQIPTTMAWGNITGKPSTFTPSTHYHNYFPENTAVYFRDPNNASWRGGMYWGSAGNEALCFVAVNSNTSFRFFTGSDIANWTSSTWQGTPALEVNKNGAYALHFYESSDIKLKTNVENISTTDNIPQLKKFNWKSDGSIGYGLIAQELEAMGYSELVENNGDHKTVNYSAALSLIVGKLQVKIKELEKEIEILKNKN